ncbi:Uu.00g084480.m01.CDS01 [Anthostomella pinea]|uniref:Uu.00g084480.m01.CDS01 n=1 Tax=Anthostomella pinea TaxID=933095 RepID=A0AAI8YJR0_9PEZI|nr:Uu.00g084480.m01.CDS01 [Anthostomella pinea]
MGDYPEESQEPLLQSSEEFKETIVVESPRRNVSQFIREDALLIAILLSLLYLVVALTFDVAYSAQCPHNKAMDHHFTLPGDFLQFEERREWYPPQDPWNQEPSEEVDAAWSELLYALNVRVSKEELASLGNNTMNRVQVNGGDYLGAVGVFHYLHCLNNLRKLVHRDYYETRFPGFGDQAAFGTGHADHCIDVIRQAVMCHANTGMHTAEWVDEDNELGGKELRPGLARPLWYWACT